MRAGLLVISLVAGSLVVQDLRAFVPVGVRYRPAADDKLRRRDLEEMQRLRFNVVSVVKSENQPAALSFIDRLLARAPYPEVVIEADATTAVIPVSGAPDDITLQAWSALASGARVFLFGDWEDLQRNVGGLVSAAEFAEAVTRNAALYAPLRPRESGDIRVEPPDPDVKVSLLESSEALLIVALNHAAQPRPVTIAFAPAVPEAIWRNMFNGGSVSLVTGPDGPTYRRTFGPKEVLVLMINKGLR